MPILLENEESKESLLQHSGNLFAELLDDDLTISETETSIELNFAIVKFKHIIKSKNTEVNIDSKNGYYVLSNKLSKNYMVRIVVKILPDNTLQFLSIMDKKTK